MSADLIRDHIWRPPHGSKTSWVLPWLDRPCEYLNCRRTRTEHARAVSGRGSR